MPQKQTRLHTISCLCGRGTKKREKSGRLGNASLDCAFGGEKPDPHVSFQSPHTIVIFMDSDVASNRIPDILLEAGFCCAAHCSYCGC